MNAPAMTTVEQLLREQLAAERAANEVLREKLEAWEDAESDARVEAARMTERAEQLTYRVRALEQTAGLTAEAIAERNERSNATLMAAFARIDTLTADLHRVALERDEARRELERLRAARGGIA